RRELVVEREMRFDHPLAGEQLLRPPPSRGAERARELRIGEELAERVRQRLDPTRLDEETGDSVLDELGDAPGPGGDDGHSGRHGLDDRVRTALVVARQQQARGTGEKPGNVLSGTEEADRAGQP